MAGVGARPGRLTGAGVGGFFFSGAGRRRAFFDGGGGCSSGGFSIFGFSAAGGAGGCGAVLVSGTRSEPADRSRTATARGGANFIGLWIAETRSAPRTAAWSTKARTVAPAHG